MYCLIIQSEKSKLGDFTCLEISEISISSLIAGQWVTNKMMNTLIIEILDRFNIDSDLTIKDAIKTQGLLLLMVVDNFTLLQFSVSSS